MLWHCGVFLVQESSNLRWKKLFMNNGRVNTGVFFFLAGSGIWGVVFAGPVLAAGFKPTKHSLIQINNLRYKLWNWNQCVFCLHAQDWSVEDVLQWLERKGFKEECELFKGLYIKPCQCQDFEGGDLQVPKRIIFYHFTLPCKHTWNRCWILPFRLHPSPPKQTYSWGVMVTLVP